MESNAHSNRPDTLLRTSVLDAALQLGLANPTIAGLLFNPVAEEDEEFNPNFASSSDESAVSPSFPITPPSNSTSSPTVHFRDTPRFYEDLRSSTSTEPPPPPDIAFVAAKHKLRKPPPAKAASVDNEEQKRAMKLIEKQREKEDKMREKEEKLKEKEEKLRAKEAKAREKEKDRERGRDRAEKDKDGSKKTGFIGKFRMKSRERKGLREEIVDEQPPTLPPPVPVSDLPIALRFIQGQRPSEDATLTRIDTSSTNSNPPQGLDHTPTRSSPVHSPASSLSAPKERFVPAPALASIAEGAHGNPSGASTSPAPAASVPTPQPPTPVSPPKRPEWPKGLDLSAINQYYYGKAEGGTPTAARAIQPLVLRRPLSPASKSPSQALSPARSFSPLPPSPRPPSPSPYIVPTPQPHQVNFAPEVQTDPKRPVIQFVAPPPSPRQLHLPLSPRPISPNGAPPSPLQRSRPVSPISPHPPPPHPPPPIPAEDSASHQRFLSPSRAATLPPPSALVARAPSPSTPSPTPGQPVQRGRTAPFPTKPTAELRRHPSKRVQDPRLSRRLSFTDDQALEDGGRPLNSFARKRSLRKSVHLGGYDSDDAESRYSSYSMLSDQNRGPEPTLDLAKERERFVGHQRLLDRVRNQNMV